MSGHRTIEHDRPITAWADPEGGGGGGVGKRKKDSGFRPPGKSQFAICYLKILVQTPHEL